MLAWSLPALLVLVVVAGLLMVSRVRYRHMTSALTERGQFFTLVGLVAAAIVLWMAPVPAMFLVFVGYALFGVGGAARRRARSLSEVRAP